MTTQQPEWKLVAQLGDANPVEHGGRFVYQDTTGVYSPEIEVLTSPEEWNESSKCEWTVHRFICNPCTYTNGILSDNKFHPASKAWFADKLASVAISFDVTKDSIVNDLTSDNVVVKASAWLMLADYFGLHEFDYYPLTLTRDEVLTRYKKETLA